MDHRLRTTAEARPLLQQRMVPKLMLVNSLLVLPINEMLARIEQELSENPALELDDRAAPETDPWAAEGTSLTRWTPDDEEYDPYQRIAAPVSLQEHLLMTLQAQGLSPRDHAIGERLIGYINDNGYLEATVVQVAQELNAAEEEVEAVLGRIQRFEPVGVGARNVEECLLLQLRVMEPTPVNRLAQRIVETHLADLAARRFEKVAQALGVKVAEVRDAQAFIKATCYPYPGERYRLEREEGTVRPGEVARPDFVIRRTEEGFAVELVRQDAYQLRVNAFYEDLRRQMRRASAGYSAESREHVRDYVSRAKLFIEAVQRRNWTMANIVQAVVRTQWEYLERGDAYLKPLTKAMVATELGISESTVSRALDGKFVQLPNGRVVSFDIFFDQSLPIKDRIREIIAAETRPLTDEEIARLLLREGIRIARRTVTKYREELAIPPSTARGGGPRAVAASR
ncbi:MAG: RNA polymerase factor sigma-54 [Armatimonadota bacterium]|nr:RNA polymerase factor sigma-54 [Armatimonadota bacterium]MDR7451419.1 RNA polymerase factor sigma-54 [Armatimonadota bacterium]MDR7466431.1 RNA polymerase factor sigma-54 [Armatimonadota bacterium]MDR7493153.1 RNA polymerase factor sigma-54 [Armatimonadota bacterium]MDR7500342.1 RNA polymerase factor sigma-54 [Armatimonadota bacterium]